MGWLNKLRPQIVESAGLSVTALAERLCVTRRAASSLRWVAAEGFFEV